MRAQLMGELDERFGVAVSASFFAVVHGFKFPQPACDKIQIKKNQAPFH
jgi:hypothetical protein